MSQQSHESRPKGATVVAILVGFGAIFYLALGLWLAFSDVPAIAPQSATVKPLPEWVSLVNGLMSLTIGLIYIVLLRMVLGRTNNAYPMIQAIALVNASFGLFRLPAGVLPIALSAVILIMSNNEETKSWLKNGDS